MAKVKVGRKAIEAALRNFVPLHIDYDIHKEIEAGEFTDEIDDYPRLAREFMKLLKN